MPDEGRPFNYFAPLIKDPLEEQEAAAEMASERRQKSREGMMPETAPQEAPEPAAQEAAGPAGPAKIRSSLSALYKDINSIQDIDEIEKDNPLAVLSKFFPALNSDITRSYFLLRDLKKKKNIKEKLKLSQQCIKSFESAKRSLTIQRMGAAIFDSFLTLGKWFATTGSTIIIPIILLLVSPLLIILLSALFLIFGKIPLVGGTISGAIKKLDKKVGNVLSWLYKIRDGLGNALITEQTMTIQNEEALELAGETEEEVS